MKFILHKPFGNNFATDLLDKVDGVFLKYSIGQFFSSGTGYNNFVTDVKNEIAKYNSVGIAIQWGALCTNRIWNTCPYIELIERHHESEGPPVYNKFPLPYDTGYLLEVKSFLEYFADTLYPVMEKISYIKITGINQQSFEWRQPNQHFKDSTTTPSQAYKLAAEMYLALGYTNEKMREACKSIIGYYDTYFRKPVKIGALIQGTAGFPKIDDYGKFNLKPPVINDSILFYLSQVTGTAVMATALTDTSGTPANFISAGLPMWYQLNNGEMNKSLPKEKFEAAILNGKNHGAQGIEIYEINVREHADVILKYQS